MVVRFSDLVERYGDRVCVLADVPFYDKYFENWCDDVSFRIDEVVDLEYDHRTLVELLALKDINIADETYSARDLYERKYRKKFWDAKSLVDSYFSDKLWDMVESGEIDFEVELSAEFMEALFNMVTWITKERFVNHVLRAVSEQTLFDVAKHLELKEVDHIRTLDHYYEVHEHMSEPHYDLLPTISNRIMKLKMPQMFEATAQMISRDLETEPY